jgi:D-alanyl-D-alanine carboxypeptidase
MYWVQVLSSTDIGTQADLLVGKYLKLEEVYYGMMLPSGNDAALNLAFYYGYLLGRKNRFPQYEWNTCKYISL